MSTAKRHRRLGKDIQQVIKADDPQISIHLVNGSTHDIKALLIPVCAPYAGGMYSFSLKFPEVSLRLPFTTRCPRTIPIARPPARSQQRTAASLGSIQICMLGERCV